MTKANEQAFPVFVDCGPGDRGVNPGFTKREYFAGLMMQSNQIWDAIMNRNNRQSPITPKELSEIAVALADALIEELNK